MRDIRDEIFRRVAGRRVTAAVIADDHGIVAETTAAAEAAVDLGMTVMSRLVEGRTVKPGDEIARVCGTPKQVAMAEDRLIGLMAKPSGIATAARRFVEAAGPRPRIVSGAWKKMPPSQKESIRRAVTVGGAAYRVSDRPFLYLDKNYIRMLGGITACLDAVSGFSGYVRVIQLKGDYGDIADEAYQAARSGAGIIFIDSGRTDDLGRVNGALHETGLRDRVEIAFGGNIRLGDLDAIKALDVDIVDVGRQIVDAPLLDMRLEVIEV